jgi:ribosomal protein L27
MSEHTTQQRILLACGSGPVRLWRNNVGTGWAGQATKIQRRGMVAVEPGDIIVRQGRPLHAGLCVGSSDLIGYRQVDGVAQFVALEVKSATGRPTAQQTQFIDHINAVGGCAGIVRSVEDAHTVLGSDAKAEPLR